MERQLTIAGAVGEGDRNTLYRTLMSLPGRHVFCRSHDTVLIEIARLMARECGKGLTCLPWDLELDPEREFVCIFTDNRDAHNCPYTRLFKRWNVPHQRLII